MLKKSKKGCEFDGRVVPPDFKVLKTDGFLRVVFQILDEVVRFWLPGFLTGSPDGADADPPAADSGPLF